MAELMYGQTSIANGRTKVPVAVDLNGNVLVSSSTTDPSAVILGTVDDAAVVTDASGTLSAKLRGLIKILADVWVDAKNALTVDVLSTGGVVSSAAQQVVAVSGTSAQSAAMNAASTRAILTSTTDCWVAWGSNPTAAVATTGNIFLTAGVPSYPISVTGGTTKFAAIQVSAAGYLSILESA